MLRVTGGHDGSSQIVRGEGVHEGGDFGYPHVAEKHEGPEIEAFRAVRHPREGGDEIAHAQPDW